MIAFTIVNPPTPTLVKGIRHLWSTGDIIGYHVSINKAGHKQAHMIFPNYKGFRYIVALLDEAEFFKKES